MERSPRQLTCVIAALVGLCLTSSPTTAEELKRLAFVSPVAPTTVLAGEAAFWTRLSELGWIEGKTLEVRKYFASADRSRLPALMKQALQSNPDVLVTPGTPAALEAKRATTKYSIS